MGVFLDLRVIFATYMPTRCARGHRFQRSEGETRQFFSVPLVRARFKRQERFSQTFQDICVFSAGLLSIQILHTIDQHAQHFLAVRTTIGARIKRIGVAHALQETQRLKRSAVVSVDFIRVPRIDALHMYAYYFNFFVSFRN